MQSRVLGAFELRTPISTGGMGTVWLARQVETQTLVAVKVLAASASDPFYIDGFKREVKAIARLRHPRIVTVFDYGLIPENFEGEAAGSPWLAMELATRGSLLHSTGIHDFATVRGILFDTLEALAHSHARGIVHRDIKPGNILLVEESGAIRCKLSDFGIAHANEESVTTREVFATTAGTPWYMAPEQIEARWRDYGPHTDLYALGCVAYQLATGNLPFPGTSPVLVAQRHLTELPPPLRARFEVPDGFAGWVARLMSKDPNKRYSRAADAAWALSQLAPSQDDSISLAAPHLVNLPERTQPFVRAFDATATALDSAELAHQTLPFLNPQRAGATTPTLEMTPVVRAGTSSTPPVPEDWRPASSAPMQRFATAGIGLFGLRETPFVARERERDLLWQALRDATGERLPRAVILRGPSGAGKTRLAEWMAKRTHELGVATPLRSIHGPVPARHHGTEAMLERHLNCENLDAERTFDRALGLLTERGAGDHALPLASAVSAILHPNEPKPRRAVPHRIRTEADTRGVLLDLMRVASAQRTLVFVMDDIHYSYSSLALVRDVLEHRDLPILVILTVSDEIHGDLIIERELIDAIASHARCTTLDLELLDDEAHRELLDGCLPIEPGLRDAILSRARGNPLYSLQLLEEWVANDLLATGPAGYVLRAEMPLPGNLRQVWMARLRSVLGDAGATFDANLRLLGLAAVLGSSVRLQEWFEIAESLELVPDRSLIDRLADRGLARWTDNGFAFTEEKLRRTLLEIATERGANPNLHLVVALWLASKPRNEVTLRRLIRHFVDAGANHAALEPIFQLAAKFIEGGRGVEGHSLLTRARRLIREGGFALTLPEELRLLELSARVAFLTADFDAMEAAAREILDLADPETHPAKCAFAYGRLAMHRFKLAKFDEGLELMRQALDIVRRHDLPAEEAPLLRDQGWLLLRVGRFAEAKESARAAVELFRGAGDFNQAGSCLATLSDIARSEGDVGDALRYAREAVALKERTGERSGLTAGLLSLALAQREDRDFASALDTLERTRSLWPSYQLDVNAIVSINEAHVFLMMRKPAEAQSRIDRADEGLARVSNSAFSAFSRAYRLACAAQFGDTEHWQAVFNIARGTWPAGLLDSDVADILSLAGDDWRRAGNLENALNAYQFALHVLPHSLVNRRGALDERIQNLEVP